jgi:hypothetical protein
MIDLRLESPACMALRSKSLVLRREVIVSAIGERADEWSTDLAAFEPGLYTAAQCADLAEKFARLAKAAETASARAASRAAERGEHRKRGFADAKDWMARASGSTVGEARAALDTIKNVSARPQTHDALLSGEVSLAQAEAIVSAPIDHEDELLELARTSSAGPVRAQARKRRLEAMHINDLHAKRHAAREFVHWTDDELGMFRGRFALPPEIGVPIVTRLDRETDRIWRDAKRNGREVTRAQCAADAFMRMLSGRGKANPGRADIVFVLDLNAWLRGEVVAGETCHILGGGPIPLSVVQHEVKSAFVKVVLHDGTKVDTIVHYGRRRPALLQSVLDLGPPPEFEGVRCADDDCERRYGLEWDHVDPVANGGPTSCENLKPRCPPHHWRKTERDRAEGKLEKKSNRKEQGP